MNIGIVTSWFARGAAYVSKQYLEVLTPRHRVFIYCRDGELQAKGDPAWDGDFVTWGPKPIVDDPSAVDLEDFSRWLDKKKIECVLFNEQRSWAPVILCARRKILNGAYVVHYREDTIPFFDCHDFVICNSRHHYDIFEDHSQAVFLPWGTDLDRFHPGETSPVQPGRVTFFHSGGMNPHRKGTDLVLEAMRRLDSHYAHLVLHTQVEYGNYAPEQAELLKDLRQKGLITMIEGTVPDLAALYRHGDVCVYPTRHEGLGLTIAESLASGVPILVTDQPPVNEHADGEVVRPIAVKRRYARSDGDYWPQSLVDVNALAEEMGRIAEHPEQFPRLQQQARKKAQETVDWKKNAGGLAEQFANFRVVESARKSSGMDAAERYEAEKWRRGLRNWVGSTLPGAVRTARRFTKLK